MARDETYLDLPCFASATPVGRLLVTPFEGSGGRDTVETRLL